ncbi:MAG: hypothetical protein WAW52_03035 [Methanothrix sp.]
MFSGTRQSRKSHFSALPAPGGRPSLCLPCYIHIMPAGSFPAGGVYQSADLRGH